MSSKQNIEVTSGQVHPTKYGIILFPGFQLLDVFGPLDALSVLSTRVKLDPLIIIAETLDPVYSGSAQSMWNSAGSDFGASVVPTHTFETVPDDLEVLLVPGGSGAVQPGADDRRVEFIKKTYPKLKYLVTICNGVGLAAQAGVLDGKRATADKAIWVRTTSLGPSVNWVKTARWVADGNIWTSSGVSAGLDVTLGWIAEVFGEETAREVANVQEYEWKNDANWDVFGFIWGDGM
ncbi:class I glutamine amidotransferase-like protein [Dichomitus squalens LYAD-421 SS1]|uniref:class I glutamine amidotransferase-like protein n=1 Tax=Dichomitus squalens (strain LYAD-421) TaxID=732165 RepID=UPI00044107FC|nr:class I glutamine amidotransferase-like protein [Dichomitus squalens LYAD-421 SS1]EJF65582.1 class I glutamine amidotransferase-like protein [Dichomitus squalens LYAD-421 SS1]